ncbi:A-type_flavoprotein 2 [Hexamita inflata]|uniref:A-type flavoprotein 2 n=1 Tax=Hexamita inflata TaxID=28002 RepID=A0AA86NT49_9EUKA|nr:A-type flavoprotein 2 [Hexamita inflata]
MGSSTSISSNENNSQNKKPTEQVTEMDQVNNNQSKIFKEVPKESAIKQKALTQPKSTNVEMIPDVYWVGVIDWALRIFHSYHTEKGTSYNSFMIMDEKPTLVDTVKFPFAQEHFETIRSVIPLSKIEYIIMNHSEPDHGSALPLLYAQTPQATIVTNSKCKENLEKLYPDLVALSPKWLTVDSKSTLCIGKRTLSFIPVPMIHWPCNMLTYSQNEGAIFTNDVFGQHHASTERWAEQLPIEQVIQLTMSYNANVLGHLPAMIKNALNNINKVDIKYILTSHGVCWRGEQIKALMAEYARFANQAYRKKVSIIFDTMYGSTAKAVEKVAEGVRSTGSEAKIMDLNEFNITDVALHVHDSACFAIGSPTQNNTMMPLIEQAINYCRGLKLLAGKSCYIFGAFCWTGAQCCTDLTEAVKKCNANIEDTMYQWRLQVTDENLAKLYEYGVKLGLKAQEIGK